MKNNQHKSNSYKNLMLNTVIFGIGSFSSKLLVFLLLPLYTFVLSPEEFNSVDLMIQVATLLIPLATLSISDAVIRFGLDRKYNKATVFTTSIFITIGGLLIFTAFMPLISQIKYVSGYGVLMTVYVVIACIKRVCSEFVRAKKQVKLYAFNGILTTFFMIALNLLFLLVFKWGRLGYILAIIGSDFISIIFLFVVADLMKFLKIGFFSKDVAKQMLVFSIPLIPTAVMWWITNLSDRFLVAHFLGGAASGLYAISYKIPTIITTIYSMFNQAWNMSAITEYDKGKKSRFYSNVFNSNLALIFMIASGILVFLIPITHILVDDAYFISYKYTPILLISAVFTCFTSFLGSIYSASKMTKNSLSTSFVGAILNIGLNLYLIPHYGVNGASVATLVSYMVVFIIRLIDTRKIVTIKVDLLRIFLNTLALGVMAYATIYWQRLPLIIALISMFIFMLLLNISIVLRSLETILPARLKKFIPFIK